MSNIRPLRDHVVIERLIEATSAGGIVIPDSSKEKPARGKIISVGPGKWQDGDVRPLAVSIGEEVLFGKYAGTEVSLEGSEYVLLKEEDIMGIVE